jgi:hypothetical protein
MAVHNVSARVNETRVGHGTEAETSDLRQKNKRIVKKGKGVKLSM